MIKRNLKVILIYCTISIVGILLYIATWYRYRCQHVHSYDLEWFAFITDLVKGFFISVGILVICLIIRKFIAIKRTAKLVAFTLLPFLAFGPLFVKTISNISNAAIESALCRKLNGGMKETAKGLSSKEYEYLKQYYYALPDIPASAHHIDMSYYAEMFTGEYIIELKLKCDIKESIDTAQGRWYIINIDKRTGIKELGFEDHN